MDSTTARRAGVALAAAVAVATVAAPALATTATKPTALTLTAKHETVPAGTEATFTAHLTSSGKPVAGKTVTLWERVAHSKPWQEVQTSSVPTDSKGDTTLTSKSLLRNEEFEARFAGANGYRASHSGTVTVHVAWVVTLTGPQAGMAGAPLKFQATVAPAAKGKIVLLQVAHGQEWKTIAQAKENASGIATFQVKEPIGRYTFRARANADSAHATGVSNEVTTTVS